jgi:hypothetical protein
MTDIPPNPVTVADLSEWYRLNEELKKIKGKEMLLRQKIFGGLFIAPREGTNNLGLNAGYVLKGTHTINRTVDPAALDAMTEKFAEEGIFTDQLIERKPTLKISAYRELTEEQRQVFDQCLVVKDGAPALEITLPKRSPGNIPMAHVVGILDIPAE